MKRVKFLHLIGPDTKNSYGIMSHIYKNFDMTEHQFLITSYEECRLNFPKLNEFPENWYIPKEGGRLKRAWTFYKLLKNSEYLVWHSLYFSTKKYLYFLYFFRKFLKKSVWVEWGADLCLWEIPETGLKTRILNYMGKHIRENFRYIGFTFPVNEYIYKEQFNNPNAEFFYTPLPNPDKEATGLIDYMEFLRPDARKDGPVRIQIAHNCFNFNNHIKIMDMLERFNEEDVKLILPLTYGSVGIGGRFGGKAYVRTVKKYASDIFKSKVSFMNKNIPFNLYVNLLWSMDIAVFDFDRPCGLGNLRMLLYMGKKVFLPSNSPFYDFLISKGVKIYDTNSIPSMTYEEFISPPEKGNSEWILDYLNNDCAMKKWDEMFRYIEDKGEKAL